MKKEIISLRCLQFCLIFGLGLLAFGCSDGGGYDNQGTGATFAADGTVAQGKIRNAKVCADINFNDRCDVGEPFTFTNASTAFAGSYIVRNIPANTPYQFITEGGIDSLTNEQALPLKALAGVRNITPITTLVAQANPAEQAALIELLDNLSGGQGYDIDISSDSMPPEFLSLVKIIEKTFETLAVSGLSSASDQAQVMALISTQLLAQPLEVSGNTLGTIFEAVANQIATSNAFTDFEVAPADIATFSGTFETLATQIEAQVNTQINAEGAVVETPALQALIEDNVTIPVLPVGSVTLFADTISIFNSATLLQDRFDFAANPADLNGLTVTAGSFATAQIIVKGSNTLTPATVKNYADASFTLNVTDTESNRSLQIVVAGVDVMVSATGVVTLSGGTTLELIGVNGNGSLVVQKSLGNLGTLVTISGSIIAININALQSEVETAEVGSVTAIGSYDVSATISGAPGVPAAVALTVN